MTDRATWGTCPHNAHQLRERLKAQQAQPRPSEAVLCHEFGVSRTTIRRALTQIADDGTITSRSGIGWTTGPAAQTPRHRQVTDTRRARITSGHSPPSSPLPSEAAAAEEFTVARGTDRYAFGVREAAGLVASVRGPGRFGRQP